MLRVTGFNMFNHPNYYVESGSGINQQEYKPLGPDCVNKAPNQSCYLFGRAWKTSLALDGRKEANAKPLEYERVFHLQEERSGNAPFTTK
jgi:hypothetical protein